jgi:uncharacterized protein YjbJ (UPF0337 family)
MKRRRKNCRQKRKIVPRLRSATFKITIKNFMTKLEVKGDLNIIKGKLKQKRAKFADDGLQYVAGKSEELLGQLQKHTGDIHEAVKASAAGRCE